MLFWQAVANFSGAALASLFQLKSILFQQVEQGLDVSSPTAAGGDPGRHGFPASAGEPAFYAPLLSPQAPPGGGVLLSTSLLGFTAR